MTDGHRRRRAVLAALGSASLVSLAGCSNSGGERTPGSDDACTIEAATGQVSATPASFDGRLEAAEATIDLRWNARCQVSVADSPDAYTYYEAEAGEKYLVYRLAFTNTTDEQLRIDAYQVADFRYETEDTIRNTQWQLLSIDQELGDVTLKPGGTTSGVVVCALPDAATSATLSASEPNFPDVPALAFEPSCDRSLSIDVPEHEDTV